MGFDVDQTITTLELASLIGTSDRWIRKLEGDGAISKVAAGKYCLSDAVRALIAHAKTSAAREATTQATAREAFDYERARQLKLKNDMLEKQLMKFDVYDVAVAFAFGMIKQEFAGVAPRLSRDPLEQRRVNDVLDDVLATLTARQRAAAQALAEGLDPFDAVDTLFDGRMDEDA